MNLQIITFILTIILMAISIVTDIRSSKILNAVTFPAMAIGLILAGFPIHATAYVRLAWMAGFFFFGMLGLMGLGDIKLIMAVIALRGYMEGVFMLLFGAVCMIFFMLIVNHTTMVRSLKETANSFLYKSDMITRTHKGYPFAPFLAIGYICSCVFVYFVF